MAALSYIIEQLLSLALLALLLRLLLQWVRADFRNPIARGLVNLSNPVVVPLRRLLPAIGRMDTALVLLVLAVVVVKVAVAWLLGGAGLDQPLWRWLVEVLRELAHMVLWVYFFAIFLYALLTLVAPGTYSPAQALLVSLCEPVLRPLRRIIPPLGGLDFSPLWAGIIIQALLIAIRY
ncbi:MAG TPA: YggT family protein [Steroidobacteraceae bacterium]|nr:YggT family protein [Steroidobacteraceae bacterium]